MTMVGIKMSGRSISRVLPYLAAAAFFLRFRVYL